MFLQSRWIYLILTLLIGVMLAVWLVPLEQAAVEFHLQGFPDAHVMHQRIRPWVLAFLSFMPFLAVAFYCSLPTFEKYLAREFFVIFCICLGSLYGLWFIGDLGDNIGDFDGAPHLLASVLQFYALRLPSILILLLPYTLLLSLLYGLGKFSKTNEIVAMIQSGYSLLRVTRPVIFAGIWCSVFLLGLNYQWAPHSEGKRDELVARAKGLPIHEAQNVLYRDPYSQRLWLVGVFPENSQAGAKLLHVEVTTLHEDNTLKNRLNAARASWNPSSREWLFEEPLITHFTKGESPRFERGQASITRTWAETPAQIVKPGLKVEHLGIPDLSSWLQSPLAEQAMSNRASYLTHWHYRWALPFSCLVTVILAAPLSIYFTRKGGGSGVFVAILLSVLMIFFSSITLSLGEAEILHPALAAWSTNIGFSLLGLWLYQRRMSGLPLRLFFQRLRSIS